MFHSKRHRRATRVASAVLAGLGALATGVHGNASGATSLASVKIGVPAYFWPGGNWDKVVANSADISFAVANIATGPGAAKNTSFVTQFAAAKSAGIKLFGYVDTTYGARSAAAIKTDIANYKSWYGITNIFFDETPWACDSTAYYADLQSVVHANGGTGILNPGGSSLDCWAPVGDIIVNFEGSAATYNSWAADDWTNQYPASKFWHIVYGTLAAQVPDVVAKAKDRNAATVFVTDDIMPNPFDRMPDPTVWTPLLKAIGPAPVVVTTAGAIGGSGGTPSATATLAPASTSAPVITFEAIATTTTEAPTTVAPTTTLAPTTTTPPTTAAPTTVPPTSAPTTAATSPAPKATATTVVAKPAPAPAAAQAPAAAPTPAPAPAVANSAASNPATVFGSAPSGGGVQIVGASEPAKADPAKLEPAKPDSPKTDASKPSAATTEATRNNSAAAESVKPAAGSGPASATPGGPVSPAVTPPAGPAAAMPNSLALKPSGKKPAKPSKTPNKKVAAKPVAKAPKSIAKPGPKITIAKAPAKSLLAQQTVSPISASRIASEH